MVLAVGAGLQFFLGRCDTMARGAAVSKASVLGYTSHKEMDPVVSNENGRVLVALAVGAGVAGLSRVPRCHSAGLRRR